MIRRTPFDIPLVLFVLAASIGTYLVAWDVASAQAKLTLIIAGVAVYYLLVFLPSEVNGKGVTRIMAVAAPLVLSLFFIWTFDWSSRIGKVRLLDPYMRLLDMIRLPLPSELLNSNSAGGLLAALIPFQVQAIFGGWTRWFTPGPKRTFSFSGNLRSSFIGVALVGVSLITLVLSASRGAWIALALTSIFWAASKLTKRAWKAALLLVLLCGTAWAVIGAKLTSAVTEDRVPVWTGASELASDYLFTGIGPANFAMSYSSYTILIHVPYLYHAHDLYLDAWLDGGLLGLFAILMIGVTAVRQAHQAGLWRVAAIACIVILAIHGLLDDALLGYAPAARVLMWMPLALVARVAPPVGWRVSFTQGALVGALALGAALMVLVVPPIRSVWETNLGAVAQAKLELPGYDYQTWGQQDKRRRDGQLDYQPVLAHYQAALAMDAGNPLANRRLAQIEIARGSYDSAKAHLAQAFDAAPRFRATREMLGEMDAIDGQTGQAAELWRSIDRRQNQLEIRYAWYRDFLKDDTRAGRVQDAMTRANEIATPH